MKRCLKDVIKKKKKKKKSGENNKKKGVGVPVPPHSLSFRHGTKSCQRCV